MPAPRLPGFVRTGGEWKAASVARPRVLVRAKLAPSPVESILGPALAGLVTSAMWGGLARAVGMHWLLALAVAVLTGAFALVFTALVVAAAALEDSEAVRQGLFVRMGESGSGDPRPTRATCGRHVSR